MKKNVLAMIGAMLGGLVATLPWVLVYVYGNMMYSILAIFVAMGALFGYQLFKGEINKNLPIKIMVVSLLSITIATLVIIPCLLLAHEGAAVTINNFKYLYSDSDFIGGIITDYIVSVLFTLLGISGVIKSIKNQVANNSDKIKIDLRNGNNKKDRMLIKKILLDKGAIDSNSAYIFSDEDKINNDTLNILLTSGEVVRVDDDKYYYDSKKEVENKKQNKKSTIIVIVLLLAVIGVLVYFANRNSNNDSDNDNKTQELIKYTVPSGYMKYDDEEGGYLYVLNNDLSGDLGYIDVYNLDGEYEYSTEFINNIMTTIEKEGELLDTDEFTNKYNYKVVYFEVKYDKYSMMVYYIFSGSDLGVVEVINYSDNSRLYSDGKEIANVFTWNKLA